MLESLHLRNFRNFAEQRLEFPPAGVALVGDNGQGKTNLLEAIYYLEIFRSFRGAPDEQLVRFGEEVFRLEARVRGGARGAETVAAAYDRKARKKKVTLGGVEPPRIGDAIGRVGVVVFSPSDVEIVAGAPSVRRRFLDILLSLTVPGYLDWLQKYRQVLGQRNALLREGAARAQVSAWDAGLVDRGARIVLERRRWAERRAGSFADRVREISEGGTAALGYRSSIDPPDPGPADLAGLTEHFRHALAASREREERRGATLVGPHRDDLTLRAAAGARWTDLRTYGSGGQQRTAAVALRMVEAETLREGSGSEPVFLLDDVFAELDPGRSRRILEWVAGRGEGQVILTAPKPSDFDFRTGELARWTIRAGEIRPL